MGGEPGAAGGPATFDVIGAGYDETRRPDPRITKALMRHLAPRPGGLHLDLACGTGNYTAALAARGVRLVGVDRSGLMLSAARAKSRTAPLCLADAARLSFRGAAFAGALCTLAIHHFPDLDAVAAELGRVLRPGARLVIFTAFPEQMRGYWLNAYFPDALERSMVVMPSADGIRTALRAHGFGIMAIEPWDVPPDLGDCFLYSGKDRPGLYLDPAVRRGISTFSLLADPGEVVAGLARLAADIASGRIDRVRARYAGRGGGDYAFVVAERLAAGPDRV